MITTILSQCGWVDVVLIVFIIFGAVAGLKNGLLKEVPKIFSFLIAVIVSLHYYKRLGDKVAANSFLSQFAAEMIAYILIALVTLAAIQFLARLIEGLIKVTYARPLDLGGGMLLGAVRYYLFFALISYGLLMFSSPYLHESYSSGSFSGPFVEKTCTTIYDTVLRFVPLP